MEVKLIKTCHGFEEIKFLDGALVPPHEGIIPILEMSYFDLGERMQKEELEVWKYLMSRGLNQSPEQTSQS